MGGTEKIAWGETDEVARKIQWRNYFPKAPELQVGVQQRVTTAAIEAQIEDIIKQNQKALEGKEWMLPTAKKTNWDIKRDFNRKLHVLENRTEAAMAVLIRRQILESQGKLADGRTEEPPARENRKSKRRDPEVESRTLPSAGGDGDPDPKAVGDEGKGDPKEAGNSRLDRKDDEEVPTALDQKLGKQIVANMNARNAVLDEEDFGDEDFAEDFGDEDDAALG